MNKLYFRPYFIKYIYKNFNQKKKKKIVYCSFSSFLIPSDMSRVLNMHYIFSFFFFTYFDILVTYLKNLNIYVFTV